MYPDILRNIQGVNTSQYILSKLKDITEDKEFLGVLDITQQQMLQNLNSSPGYFDSYRQNIINLVSLYVSYSVDKVKNVSKFQDAYKDFEGKIKLAETNLIKINETARHISGATALTAYANGFDNQAKEHEDSAFKWLVLMILSVILFALFVGCLLFFNLGEFNFIKDIFADDVNYRDKLVLTSLALKAAFIFAYIQVIKFISRNYNAHKHLQEVYLHRRNVLQTLHAVYEAIGEGDEKNKILYAGAITAFDRGETGYITTKEGAGSDDGLMQILLSKLK